MPDVTDLCEDMEVMTEIPVLPPSSPMNLFPHVSPTMTSFHPSVSPTRPPSPLAPSGGEASEVLSSHSSSDDSRCGSAGARRLSDKNSKCSDGDKRQEEGKATEESDDRCSSADEGENYIDVIGDTDCSDTEMTDDRKSGQVEDSSKTSADDDNNNNHQQQHNGGNSRRSRRDEHYRSNDQINSDDSVNERDDEQNVSPLSHTNFSIAAILKPDFGVRKGAVISRLAVSHNSHSSDYFQAHSHQRLNSHSSSFHLFGHRHNHSNDTSNHHHHAHSHRYHQHHPLQRLNSPSPVDLTTRGRGQTLLEKDKKQNSDSRQVSNSNRHSKNSKDICNDNNRSVNNKNITNNGNSSASARHGGSGKAEGEKFNLWPAWVFCTRYSDRPSSGPRLRKIKRRDRSAEEKRPRTAFTNEQLARLKKEFDDCRYLTENRRRHLATDLGLTEAQIKIWFQNKRAKIKKSSGLRNPLALQLMAQGLYNHSTLTVENADGDVRGTDAVEEIVVS